MLIMRGAFTFTNSSDKSYLAIKNNISPKTHYSSIPLFQMRSQAELTSSFIGLGLFVSLDLISSKLLALASALHL